MCTFTAVKDLTLALLPRSKITLITNKTSSIMFTATSLPDMHQTMLLASCWLAICYWTKLINSLNMQTELRNWWASEITSTDVFAPPVQRLFNPTRFSKSDACITHNPEGFLKSCLCRLCAETSISHSLSESAPPGGPLTASIVCASELHCRETKAVSSWTPTLRARAVLRSAWITGQYDINHALDYWQTVCWDVLLGHCGTRRQQLEPQSRCCWLHHLSRELG